MDEREKEHQKRLRAIEAAGRRKVQQMWHQIVKAATPPKKRKKPPAE